MKKNNFWGTILKVLSIFLLFEIFTKSVGKVIGRTLWQSLRYGKYGNYFISEITVLFLVVVLLIVLRKWYIFKKSDKKLINSLVIGGPIFVLSILFFVVNSLDNIMSLNNFNIANIVSLMLFCITIGLFEEILFRGIIQNELIENYGKTRKEVIISIVIASIIFGGAHITNVFYGQDIFTTIMQVIQTIAIGLVLGSVYYNTKNIWAVAILHGFYDFALMLSDVFLYKDCVYVDNLPFNVKIASIGISLVIVVVYVTYAYIMLQKTKINPILNIDLSIDEKKKDKKNKELAIIIAAIIGSIIYIPSIVINALNIDKMDKYYICYDYEEKYIKEYETIYYNKNNFYILINDINMNINIDNYNLSIINNEESKIIDYSDDIIKLVSYYDGYTYHLAYIKTDYNDYKVYYSNYLNDDMFYSSDLIEKIEKSFKEYVIPDASYLGVLKDLENNDVYLFVKTSIDDIFLVNSDNIFVLK